MDRQDFLKTLAETCQKIGWQVHAYCLLRHAGAQARAERIRGEELRRLGWTEADLTVRHKSNPDKLAIAARLRRETTLSLKAITHRVGWGTSKGAHATLHRWMQEKGQTAKPVREMSPKARR